MHEAVSKDNSLLIDNARSFAIQNFTEEQYGKKIEQVYNSVMIE